METNGTKVCKECGRELPVQYFKMSRYGVRVDVCTECAVKKLRATKAQKAEQKAIDANEAVENARKARLEDFTPRELMKRLSELGYVVKLTYTKVVEIDINGL